MKKIRYWRTEHMWVITFDINEISVQIWNNVSLHFCSSSCVFEDESCSWMLSCEYIYITMWNLENDCVDGQECKPGTGTGWWSAVAKSRDLISIFGGEKTKNNLTPINWNNTWLDVHQLSVIACPDEPAELCALSISVKLSRLTSTWANYEGNLNLKQG